MNKRSVFCGLVLVSMAVPGFALSLAPEEFKASRDMACVLVQKELGLLGEAEYGAQTHGVLDGFDEGERDTILAKALGYYDGLLFAVVDSKNPRAVERRLQEFIESSSCAKTQNEKVVNI